ncbi:MAG: hypothetical protein OYL41_04475 [Acidobacteriota bacterium]|nr:hypothetical protein [Acidobacteriota bacterium]
MGDDLPLLTTLLTTLAAVVGAVVMWARISDRTVSRAVEKAAAVAVDSLYERLQSNDFRHVEAKIESARRRRTPTGKQWNPVSGNDSTVWTHASSAWRPGCERTQRRWKPGSWQRFSGIQRRATPNPGLDSPSPTVGLEAVGWVS